MLFAGFRLQDNLFPQSKFVTTSELRQGVYRWREIAVFAGQGSGFSSNPTVLPFTGLHTPDGVTVDAAGNLYVTDTGNNRVVKLPVG